MSARSPNFDLGLVLSGGYCHDLERYNDRNLILRKKIHGDQPQLWDFITMLCLNGDT